MNDRFKFRACVTLTYFDEEDNEKEVTFICEPDGIFKDGEIGIHGDKLYDLLKQFEFSEVEWNSLREQLDNYESSDNWYVLYPDYIIQCTGLKDKNDKLIYEGDIIELTRARNYGYIPRGSRLIIKWNIFDCCGFSTGIRGNLTKKCAENCIVVGNIHENKEFLDD